LGEEYRSVRLKSGIFTYLLTPWCRVLLEKLSDLQLVKKCTGQREGACRIKTNDELNDLIRNKNIFNYIKARRFRLSGHADGMTYYRVLKNIIYVCVCVCVCVCKPTSTGLAGRPKIGLGKRYKRRFKNFENKYLEKIHPALG